VTDGADVNVGLSAFVLLLGHMSCSSESLISSLFLPKIIALQTGLQQRASTVQATKSTGTHEAEIIAFHPIDVNRWLSLQEPFCARHSAIKNPSRVRSRMAFSANTFFWLRLRAKGWHACNDEYSLLWPRLKALSLEAAHSL
jgi:hypothetical protein